MLQHETASPSHDKTLRNFKLYARSLQEGNSTMAKIFSVAIEKQKASSSYLTNKCPSFLQ